MTPWTVARQTPVSIGFPRREYWSELPFPSPRDLLSLGIEPRSPALQADSLPAEPPGSPYSCLSEWLKVAQSWQTLCDPMDYTLHEILQARILKWVAFPFSRGSSQPRDQTGVSCIAGRFFTNWAVREAHTGAWSEVKSLSRVRLFATPWTEAYQAPPSMGFSRQEYWSGLPFPSPGDLPDPGIEPRSSEFQADALTSELPGKPIQVHTCVQTYWSNT